MRRAIGWLLPGQGTRRPLHHFSPCAPAPGWLLNIVDALSSPASRFHSSALEENLTLTELVRGLATDPGSVSWARDKLAGDPHVATACGTKLGYKGAALHLTTPADIATYSTRLTHLFDFCRPPLLGGTLCPSSLPDLGLSRDPGAPLGAPVTAALCEDDSSSIAYTATEPSMLLMLIQQVANSYELVHTATELPWAASIPLTTLALRLTLLPLSMRQARIIRSNFTLYKEALALTDQQERERQQLGEQPQGQHQQSAADGSSGAAAAASAEAAPSATGNLSSVLQARLHRSHALLANFEMLRRKMDAPHPAWIVVNPLVQIPMFVLVSTTLGMMCRLPWPGLTSEGTLWFPDLTKTAVVMETGEMPLGPAGLLLPLLVYGMTMTSLRLGFGASGLAGKQLLQQPTGKAPFAGVPDTTLSAFLSSLAPMLYLLTTLNLYFKVQMAHGILVHWLGSAGFTLSLQLALRNSALRALFKLNKLPPAAASSSISSIRGEQGSDAAPSMSSLSTSPDAAIPSAASDSGPHPLAVPLPDQLVARVAETSDPNILVIMGAQLSARHQYAGALHCFRKAALLSPSHVRAHYSIGQVFSLTGCWPDAEASYRAAAALSPAGPERGQALYCMATALHSQGKLGEAAAAYVEADANWQGQTVIAYGRANALAAAGRCEEAIAALTEAEKRDEATAGRPFRPALARLRAHLATAAATVEDGGGDTGIRRGTGSTG
ncbi:hypothetical protein VaNZ11_012037 [Volvox africanus]|uniref:Uncharacterized protein n=1 Tax=Volvox africanus TaxID=51714 RepID=A0ABQ5SEA5_9CHLO|nr:hypothetical protein VaNZ11_012037 [Volvox africanus]